MLNAWIENILLLELKPNKIVITDNASFHKPKRTKELTKSKEYILLYLPPYSLDFNSIEKMWGNMEKCCKNHRNMFEDVYEVIDIDIRQEFRGVVYNLEQIQLF